MRNHQGGFSLVELSIASTLLLGLVVLVSTLAISGTEAHDLSKRIIRMTEVAHEVTDDIRLEMVSSVQVFTNNTVGNDNLALLDLSEAPAPIGEVRLPTVDTNGQFRADTPGDEITGNSLFFAYLAWQDRFACTSGNEHRIDIYRWVHYYMSPVDGGPAPGQKGGLELVRYVSEPMADADAVDGIADPADRAEVLLHLVNATPDLDGETHAPVEVVWARGGDPNDSDTLRQIDAGDGSLSETPIAGSGRTDPWEILPSPSGVTGLLGYRRSSVASNYERVAPGVSRFAMRDDDLGFPHGFEVQVIGPTSARQVLLNFVFVDMTRKGLPAWSPMQTIITAQDR